MMDRLFIISPHTHTHTHSCIATVGGFLFNYRAHIPVSAHKTHSAVIRDCGSGLEMCLYVCERVQKWGYVYRPEGNVAFVGVYHSLMQQYISTGVLLTLVQSSDEEKFLEKVSNLMLG